MRGKNPAAKSAAKEGSLKSLYKDIRKSEIAKDKTTQKKRDHWTEKEWKHLENAAKQQESENDSDYVGEENTESSETISESNETEDKVTESEMAESEERPASEETPWYEDE